MRHLNALVPSLVLVGAVLLGGCHTPQFSAQKDFSQTISVNSQVEVVVKTFNGSISVTPSDGTEIEFVAHAKARGNTQEEADEAVALLEPQVDTTAESVTIYLTKQNYRFLSFNSVNFEVKVPRKWPLRLTSTNGAIKTSLSEGPVVAETTNGSIEVNQAKGVLDLSTTNGRVVIKESTGNVQASSTNGKLELRGGSLAGDCKLETTNGAIEVSLAATTPIEFEAGTTNGSVKCDIDQAKLEKTSKKRWRGTLFDNVEKGKTPTTLKLGTVNGSISIKKYDAESKQDSSSTTDTIPVESELN